jgi:hypothetical protein
MAVEIKNTVTLHKEGSTLLLSDLREFVNETKTFGADTKVRVSGYDGQRDPYVRLETTLGDIR